jgi:hypothetical protein
LITSQNVLILLNMILIFSIYYLLLYFYFFEEIYKKKLYAFDITQNYFRLCHDGFENFLPNKEYGITLVSAQV